MKILPAVRSVSVEQHVLEKEQAHAVRLAMEKMALQDEQRLMRDAGDEARMLIRQHEASRNDPASVIPSSVATRASPFTAPRAAPRPPGPPPALNDTRSHSPPADYAPQAHLPRKLSFSALVNRRRSSGTKRKASGRQASVSNPNDKIYEDPSPAEHATAAAATATMPRTSKVPMQPHDSLAVRRNPFARAKSTRQSQLTTRPPPDEPDQKKPPYKIDTARDPPSQPRDAGYKSFKNASSSATPKADEDVDIENADAVTVTRFKNGVEVRGDDIRAATSMKLRDRSERLPCPTVTSDDSSRPIVSFSRDRTRPSLGAAAEKGTASRLRIHRHGGASSEVTSSERSRTGGPTEPKPTTATSGPSLGIPQISINPLEREPLPALDTGEHMDVGVWSGDVPTISITAVPSIHIDVSEAANTAPSRPAQSANPAATHTRRTTSDGAQPTQHLSLIHI